MGDLDKRVLTMSGPFYTTKIWGAIVMVLLIFIFYLLKEHWTHVSGFWPYLILLVCPLMHLMHGHGKHKHYGG